MIVKLDLNWPNILFSIYITAGNASESRGICSIAPNILTVRISYEPYFQEKQIQESRIFLHKSQIN